MNYLEQDNHYIVQAKNTERVFIPQVLRRAFCWAAHFPRHHGTRLTVQVLRDKQYFWPNMEKDIQQFLTQCICVKKKLEKFKQKPHGEG